LIENGSSKMLGVETGADLLPHEGRAGRSLVDQVKPSEWVRLRQGDLEKFSLKVLDSLTLKFYILRVLKD